MSTVPPSVPTRQKYRPSAGWFVAGIALFVAATLVAVGIFVWLLTGFFRTDATVRADGQPHRISVSTDRDRMLWLGRSDLSCAVVDLDTGVPIELRRIGASFERSDSHGDFRGRYRFPPGSGDLEITCAAGPFADSPTAATVLVGPMPQIGSIVIGVLLAVVIPGLLGLVGLAMILTTGILWSLRPPRPSTP